MKHIVIDLEMSKKHKKGSKINVLETIEIGAVMLDDDLQEVSSFKTYVKPEYSDGVAANITKLTGITNEMVEHAPVFNEAAGDTFTLGSARGEIVGSVDMSLAESNENNSSIVVSIMGETAFIIIGDAEEKEEQSILDAGYDVRSTVLRVGHHGSYTSTSENFLKAVAPKYCVISVGQGNAYDYLHGEEMNRIAADGTTVCRTNLNGDITCVSDGKTVVVSTEKT